MWIEAEPLVHITTTQVHQFVWKIIICCFGIPHTIITDNGRQFIDKKLEEYLEEFTIKHKVTSVEHPQVNGQAETANKTILTEMKKWLGIAKGLWAKELLEVLWTYWCTPHSAASETLYDLTYGTDVMLLVGVGEPTIHKQMADLQINEDCMRTELDMLLELRDKSKIRDEACKQRAS